MILVDTSIWIDHLRSTDVQLAHLLESRGVMMHSYVLGEIALGRMPKRQLTLYGLADLPQAKIASPTEVLGFIERHQMIAIGIGYVDVHLLASAMLTPETKLWTRDKRLSTVAQRLGIAAQFDH